MSDEQRNVFSIRPPDDINGTKYTLIVYRSGAYGSGGRPAVVGVDRFEVSPGNVSYRGYRGDDLVIEFPGDTSYLLVASDLVKQMTSVEAAKLHKAEDDAMKEIFGKEEEELPFPTGMYR